MVAGAIGRELIVEYFDRATRRFRSPWVFYPAVIAAVILPMLVVVTLSDLAGEPSGGSADLLRFLMTRGGPAVFIVIVVTPLIETFMMWAVIAISISLSRNSDLAIVLSSAILMLLHRPGGVGKAIAIAWPFLVWGALLLSRRFESRARAFVTVWCLHAAHNAVTISLVFTTVNT